MIYLFDSQIVL